MSMIPKQSFRPQFRLIALFALVAVISVPLAIHATRERRYRRLLAAIEVLDKAGDTVEVINARDVHRGGARIVHVNHEVLQPNEVVVEVLGGPYISDEELSAILCFPTLERLSLSGAMVQPKYGPRSGGADFNEQLAKIAVLPHIVRLDLGGTRITDEGACNLAAMHSLEYLRLNATRISDWGLRDFGRLTSLRELHLGYTRISGAGLAYLKVMPRLELLFLTDDDIGDEPLRHLAEFPSLIYLGLSGTKVSDAGLMSLAQCRSLRSLDLSGCTAVSDVGLPQLRHMKALEDVALEDTSVTASGVARLHELMPNLTITWGSLDDPITIDRVLPND